MRLGLREARGDLLCYTNSARTTPEDLTLLLLLRVARIPASWSRRTARSASTGRRRIGSLLYNLECRALFDLSSWDVNGTPKVFPRAFGDCSRSRATTT